MSVKELLELEQSVKAAIAARPQSERAELKAKFEQLASDASLKIDEILGIRKARGATAKGAPAKYRNPRDASQTWTGRGRKPNWLVDAIANGQKLEAFLV